MSKDRLRDRIQDYLDGRLSEAERAAFEARLEQQPELARQVDHYRSIGQALREDEPKLSPGFYTRARTRFEGASARPHRMWRLLSWEAAGLSAAVVLAAAIFLPGLLQQDETLMPPKTPAQASPPAVDELRADDDQAAGEKPAPAKKEVAEVETAPAGSRLKQEAEEESDVAEEFAPLPEERKAAAKPDRKNKLQAETQAVGRVLADAPQAEPEPAGVAPEDRRREVAVPSQGAARGASAELGEFAAVHQTVTLDRGALEPGTVRITNEQAWRQEVQAKDEMLQKRAAASSTEGYFAETRRVVLIGARPGLLDCSAVAVEVSPHAYIVRVASGQGDTGPDCAVFLPLDEREILVVEPGDE